MIHSRAIAGAWHGVTTDNPHTASCAVLFAVLIALAAPACVSANGAGTLADIRARHTLVWGGDPSGGAPYVFTDPNDAGRYIGYEVELAQMIAHEMGDSAVFHPADWEDILPSLNRKEFDVIINGLNRRRTG